MTPAEMVVSRPLAEALKAAGVPQGQSYWVWWRHYLDHGYVLDQRDYAVPVDHTYDAFTMGELIDLLGDNFDRLIRIVADDFHARPGDDRIKTGIGQTPEEAVGQLLLHVWSESHRGEPDA